MPTIICKARMSTGWMFVACFALVCASAGAAAAQTAPSRVVVFGDSLSDPGNGFALTHEVSVPPDYSMNGTLIPDAAYAKGGHHLSNGETWIEQLARSMGLGNSAKAAFQSSSPDATNYAVGTGRANDVGAGMNLSDQVNAFLQDVGGHAPSDALYVIEFGGNDVRDAMIAVSNGGDPDPILAGAAASIATSVTTLYAAGARHFLVWHSPNVGVTPAVRLLDSITPGTASLATFLSWTFNQMLGFALAPLYGLPGIEIDEFDAFALTTAIVASPATFGFTNATSACVTPNVPPFACGNADDFFFWDGIHPTTAGHAVIAQQVAGLIDQ